MYQLYIYLLAKFPIVQGNIFYQNSSKSFWDKPYTIIEKDGVKIGVIGLHGVFAFNDTNKKGCMVSVEMMEVCIENKASLQHIINQLTD